MTTSLSPLQVCVICDIVSDVVNILTPLISPPATVSFLIMFAVDWLEDIGLAILDNKGVDMAIGRIGLL